MSNQEVVQGQDEAAELVDASEDSVKYRCRVLADWLDGVARGSSPRRPDGILRWDAVGAD